MHRGSQWGCGRLRRFAIAEARFSVDLVLDPLSTLRRSSSSHSSANPNFLCISRSCLAFSFVLRCDPCPWNGSRLRLDFSAPEPHKSSKHHLRYFLSHKHTVIPILFRILSWSFWSPLSIVEYGLMCFPLIKFFVLSSIYTRYAT